MVVEEQKVLIIAAQNGDQHAFTKLVVEYQQKVRCYIASRTPYLNDVDDLAQDTFILAFKKIAELQDTQAFSSWLCGIALNLVRNHYRKFNPTVNGDESSLAVMVDEQLMQGIENQNLNLSVDALNECLSELPQHLKALMEQHYKDNLSVKALTETHQAKHSTITMRLHRARVVLKECITNKLSRATYE